MGSELLALRRVAAGVDLCTAIGTELCGEPAKGPSPPQAWDPNPHATSPGPHCSGKPTGLGLEATCRPPQLGSGCEPRPLDPFWLSSCVCRPLRKASLSQTGLGPRCFTGPFRGLVLIADLSTT